MKNKESVAVVIPLHKHEMNVFEKISWQQAHRILSKYQIIIIAPEDLDLSNYKKNDERFLTLTFDPIYFKNIEGYNQLLLSRFFYKKFQEFQFLLIYQLDAFVFKDELLEWCQKGYDYIGAPWFYDFQHEPGDLGLWKVGNGGLSLRKVETFYRLFSIFKIKEKPQLLFKNYWNKYKIAPFLIRLPLIILKCFGYRNTYNYYLQHEFSMNEDYYYCFYSNKILPQFKIPTTEEALKFSFEHSPEYLYTLNSCQLPFGCHAWYKEDNITFWKKFIPVV